MKVTKVVFRTLVSLTLLSSAFADDAKRHTFQDASELIQGDVFSSFEPLTLWRLVEGVEAVEKKSEFKVTEGPEGRLLINGEVKQKKAPYLVTKQHYKDVAVYLEFMIPHDSNAGVYLMGNYEIQIIDSLWRGDKLTYDMLGGIYQRFLNAYEGGPKGYEGTPPLVNAAKPSGQWQTLEIVFRAPRFDAEGKKTENARFVSVHVNGVLVQDNQDVTGPTRAHTPRVEVPTGPVWIQGDHGPIAIRSLKIEALELE
ncbi:3-keto-disaccharide hydrolase [Pontiella agarivorans]|uniref:DUF1080 domain-containing protein n=1 Tax=Pontiella agarivorans TaxID=3038953 RepID=A0ABU5MW87_9BACT|nr:DUF1080 domain-containing protein [Pontiella agarivorans]MDZ8118458.1 DUF1080 domain-containing protein [Pontiella agarivorans]